MTDEELIARLRVDEPMCEEHFTANLAADRIEALIAERDAAEDKLAENEVRLGKAVEALEYYAVEAMPWDADDSLIARTALAEIKSGVATTPYGLEGESQ